MKHYRRVFARFEKLAHRYLAFVHLVAAGIAAGDGGGGWARAGPGHDAGVTAVAFSPDSQLLATASWDKTARVVTRRAACSPGPSHRSC